MIFGFVAMVVFVFPACALWAWRRNGERGLAILTVIAAAAIVVLALFAASDLGGNRIVETRGYTYTATGTLVLAGLTLVLPVIAAAMTVRASVHRRRPGTAYLLGVVMALVGASVGGVVAMYVLWQ